MKLIIFYAKNNFLLEPDARNTAAAAASAAFFIKQKAGSDALMLLLPSDHWIKDQGAWLTAMQSGIQSCIDHDTIVTFGIQTDSPKTGYGYIEAGERIDHHAFAVKSFREKPDKDTAKQFLQSQAYSWNSGMFVCRVGTLLNELNQFAPDIYQSAQSAVKKAQTANDFVRLDTESLTQCRSESIDYAVMERTTKACVIPTDIQWSDLGCWTSVAEANEIDENGNTLQGNVIAKDSQDCLVSSEKALVTTLGIKDQIIVATTDAILVADKKYSQQVKDIVNGFEEHHRPLADEHLKVSRPWGFYEVLAEGETFKVKRLMVKPGAKLSLQMHQHRSEHWVVVRGIAEIINGNQHVELFSNQSTYIPAKTKHRLSNPGNEPLYVIEVQSGTYLGEDDIQRFDDVYQRAVELA